MGKINLIDENETKVHDEEVYDTEDNNEEGDESTVSQTSTSKYFFMRNIKKIKYTLLKKICMRFVMAKKRNVNIGGDDVASV